MDPVETYFPMGMARSPWKSAFSVCQRDWICGHLSSVALVSNIGGSYSQEDISFFNTQ
jgi:hypothetical protein